MKPPSLQSLMKTISSCETGFTTVLDKDDFITWYSAYHNIASLPVPPPTTTTVPATTTGTSTANPIDQFKKGIKHDKNLSSDSKNQDNARSAAQLHQVDEKVLDTHEDVQKLVVDVMQEIASSMEKLASDPAPLSPPSPSVTQSTASVNGASQQHTSNACNIRRVLTTSAAATKESKDPKSDEIEFNGKEYTSRRIHFQTEASISCMSSQSALITDDIIVVVGMEDDMLLAAASFCRRVPECKESPLLLLESPC
jgi:hypothetical protein